MFARSMHVAGSFALLALSACALGACALTASRAEDVKSRVESEQPARPASERVDGEASYSIYDLPSVWRTQRGEQVQLSSLAGRVRVVAMVYTSCTMTCPLIIADLKQIEAQAKSERDSVGFVLVSLDPSRDTPERMATWAAQAGLDPSRWTLLAGSDDDIRELAALIDVRYQEQTNGEVAHTNGLTVLARDGSIAHRQPGRDGIDATIRVVQSLLR